MRLISLTVKFVLFFLLLAFAVKNSDMVSVRYLMGLEWTAPLSLVLLLAFALGVLLGLLAGSRHLLKGRRELARLRKTTPASHS